LPVHPRTRKRVEAFGLGGYLERVLAVEPVGYLDMVMLEKNARLIATDSGGVQKEAFFYRVPCVTLREETEWVELVELGWNRLCPPCDHGAIVSCIWSSARSTPACPPQAELYGGGQASKRIADMLRAKASGA